MTSSFGSQPHMVFRVEFVDPLRPGRSQLSRRFDMFPGDFASDPDEFKHWLVKEIAIFAPHVIDAITRAMADWQKRRELPDPVQEN